MNLRPNRRKPPELILIPLLDILLVLLIFFMVSTTFKEKDASRLHLQLPQAQGADVPEAEKEPEYIRIAIDQTGNFYVDDRAVVDQQTQTLVRAINGALGERQGLPVLIQADALTPHQAVMTALDAAAQLGLMKIAFSATRAAAPAARASGR